MEGLTFRHPESSDSRSPCPALNTLANYNILPHNGKNLTLSQLVSALQAAYNLSTPLCYVLSLTGLLTCGTFRFRGLRPTWTLDLENLALHNRIEHDASLVHADAAPHAKYAPRDVDATLLHSFLAACPAEGMDWDDFVRARAARELTLRKPLNYVRQTLACSESVSALGRLGDPQTGKFTKEALQAWFGENRFPPGYTPVVTQQGLIDVSSKTNKFRKEVEKERKAQEGLRSFLS